MVGRFVALVLTTALVHVCIVPVSADDQDQKRALEVAKVRKKIVERGVGPRATVEVQLRDGTRLLGIIEEAGKEKFTLIEIPSRRSVEIAYSDVKKVRSNLKAALNRKTYLTAFSIMGGLIVLLKLGR